MNLRSQVRECNRVVYTQIFATKWFSNADDCDNRRKV